MNAASSNDLSDRAVPAPNSPMLRLAEELLLLLYDKGVGELAPVPERFLRCALAGAVLMDLSLENRIDTDLQHLHLMDPTPVGDDLIDPCLAMIADAEDKADASFWVNRFAEPEIANQLHSRALRLLLDRGILERDVGGVLSFSRLFARTHRYPRIDGKTGREVSLRVMSALFTDEIPEPRDVMLICVADASCIFEYLLSETELRQVRGRLDFIGKLDLIGRAIIEAIQEVGTPDLDALRSWAPGPSPTTGRAYALAAIPLADGGGWPIAGHAFHLWRDWLGLLKRNFRELGPVFRLRVFSTPILVLAGRRANLFMHKYGRLHFRSNDHYNLAAKYTGGDRLLAGMDGAEHRRLRKTMRNGLSRGYFLARISQATEAVEQNLDDLPVERPIAVHPFFQRLILQQTGLLCSSISVSAYSDYVLTWYNRLMDVAISRRLPGFMMRTPRTRRAKRRLLGLYERLMEVHQPERRAGQAPDYIDDVIALHRQDPQFLPEAELQAAAMVPLAAGLHTAADTCTFVLYELLKHPDILARVRQEADELFAGEGPTATKLRGMDVMHRVGMETLRIHPTAAVLPRVTVNSFEYAGFTIPAGVKTLQYLTAHHNSPQYFPDPDRFDIDRYTPERAEHRVPGVYSPFGLGTHRCIGAGFAEMQIALVIAVMVHRLDIFLHPPGYRMDPDKHAKNKADQQFKIKVARRADTRGYNN